MWQLYTYALITFALFIQPPIHSSLFSCSDDCLLLQIIFFMFCFTISQRTSKQILLLAIIILLDFLNVKSKSFFNFHKLYLFSLILYFINLTFLHLLKKQKRCMLKCLLQYFFLCSILFQLNDIVSISLTVDLTAYQLDHIHNNGIIKTIYVKF